MKQYMLVKEMKTYGRAERESRTLVNETLYNSYEDALLDAKKFLDHPSHIIYVLEVAGKCFGSLKIETEKC